MDTMPTYTRSWTEIEWMLAEAQEQMLEQRAKFNHRKRIRDKEGCRRAAAKFARAKGMADVLTWVLEEKALQIQWLGSKKSARTSLLEIGSVPT